MGGLRFYQATLLSGGRGALEALFGVDGFVDLGIRKNEPIRGDLASICFSDVIEEVLATR
jgi:hypothetical protein